MNIFLHMKNKNKIQLYGHLNDQKENMIQGAEEAIISDSDDKSDEEKNKFKQSKLGLELESGTAND